MGYDKIKDAAQRRVAGESTGAWKLADELAAEVQMTMGPTPESSSDVATRLADIAAELEAAGIETPTGGSYTVVSLRELRLVSLGWKKADRQPEAAFRTHQETGSSDEWKRSVLRALCLAARSGDFRYPETTAIDEAAWETAVVSVRRKVHNGNRYPVSANDLRTALKRKVNVPPRDPEPRGDTVMDAIEELQEAGEHAKRAARILAAEGQHLGDSREALEGLRDSLREVLGWVDVLLSGGGITDAALAELLEGEQSV